MIVMLMTLSLLPTVQANPYGGNGWGGYHGGYYGGYHGGYYGGYHGGYYHGYGGWYGSGVPNGLGWTLFGLGAAGVVAAVAAPFVSQPVYAVPSYATTGYYQTSPQVVVTKQSVSNVSHSSEALAKAQSKLAGLGYYKGAVDGTYGPQTALAVQQFQADNNLPVSGRLDLKTLSSLGITL